jgi:hypothetical protein
MQVDCAVYFVVLITWGLLTVIGISLFKAGLEPDFTNNRARRPSLFTLPLMLIRSFDLLSLACEASDSAERHAHKHYG